MVLMASVMPLCLYAQKEKKDSTVAYEKKLSEVEIVSHYTKTLDNGDIIMRMAGNPVAEGKSLLEMLNFIPGVVFKDNEIRVNGLEGTQVYIGERKSNIEELKSLQPKQILRVEVIQFPGALYGNANGGVIKVVLRNMLGLAGNVNLGNQEDRDGYVEAALSNFTMLQNGKSTFFNNVRYTPRGIYHTKQERTDKDESGNVSETKIKYKNYDDGFDDNMSFNYDFNSMSNICIYGGIHYTSPVTTNESETDGRLLAIDKSVYSFNYNAGTIYKLKFKNNERWRILRLKAHYTATNVNGNERYSYAPSDNAKNKRHSFAVSFDPNFSFDINKKSNMTFGVLVAYTQDNNRKRGLDDSQLSQVATRRYTLGGTDFKPWAEYYVSVGKFFFRMSLTYVNAMRRYKDKLDASNDFTSRNQSGLSPMGMANWRINKKQSLRFSYRHYYSYPNFGYYNPVATYSSENFYSIGNQHLGMEKFDRFELSYSHNMHMSMYYQCRLGHNIIQVKTHKIDNTDTYYTMPENAGRYVYHQLSLYANYDIAKIWHTNNSLTFSARHENLAGGRGDSYKLYFRTSNQVDFGKKCGIGIDWEMYTKDNRVDYRYNGGYCLDVSGYYKFTKNLHVNVMLCNPIRTHSVLTIKGEDYEIVRRDKTNMDRLRINLTWNFNVGKIRRADMQQDQQMSLQDANL